MLIAELEMQRQVIQVVLRCVSFGGGEIRCESRLVEDLCIDSMGIVEIIIALNEIFDIELSENEVGKWLVVDDIFGSVRWGGNRYLNA